MIIFQRNNKGLTLIEIMIVILIISMGAMLSFPAILRVKQETNEMKIQSELRTLETAISEYYLIKSEFPSNWNDLENYLNTEYFKDNYDF